MIWKLITLLSKLILLLGRRKSQAKKEELENHVETRERMDEVARMSDADAARDWLRERGKR
jgi:hypothetical protein